MTAALLWAPRAWVDGRWREQVLLRVGDNGHWAEVQCDMAPPPQATRLPGPVLPGVVNAHSHAFQRAFAGLAERREGAHDDFWSWRERMYAVARRISPAQMQAVATQLYSELLAGGYTQVCEFHYLHHQPDGRPYADPLAMSAALAQAAQDAGIGLTLLPVLYERAGFNQAALKPQQLRFATSVDSVLAMRDGIRAWQLPQVSAGVAIHSLRAASMASIQTLARRLQNDADPVHIHIAEQTAEVDECVATHGARPLKWLCREVPLDARWQLVHATHALPVEVDAVARTGAGVVLCPSTEANLGDGLADLPRWLATGTPLSIGSDSQVCRSATEELRWLEYGQRLLLRQRNVAARPDQGDGATAARLFERCLSGGAAAAGLPTWGLVVGARADLLVIDELADGLLGVPTSHLLDAWVFASGSATFAEVWVAGQRVVTQGRPTRQAHTGSAFKTAMQALWA
jgi:formimidoylglutamate deiminase